MTIHLVICDRCGVRLDTTDTAAAVAAWKLHRDHGGIWRRFS